MTDWPVKTLGNLLEVSIGGIWGSEAGEDEVDVFVFRSTELIKDGQLKEELTVRRSITARQLDSRKLEEGDLLLEKSGGGPKTPVGRVGLVKALPGLSVCSNFMQLMRPRKREVLPVYLHYFLNHFHVAGHTEDLQNNSTNIRNLKTTEYMDVEIPVPPLEEQKRIVALLDAASVRVTELTLCFEQARTLANNLFTSALRGALEAKPDWSVKALSDFCEIYQPQTIGMKDMIADGQYVVYGANGPIGLYNRFNHEDSEVTITCRGATCGTVNVTPPHVWITGNAMVVRPSETEMTKQMMRYVLEGLDYSLVITGAAQPQITRQTLAPSKIPVPPLKEQELIVARLDLMRAKTSEMVAAYDEKLTAAKNLRQSILEAAFAGEL